MFDALSDRLEGIFSRVRNRGRLSEQDIDEVTREIRRALLEADVNVAVARSFVNRVKERALGADLSKSLTPGQQFVKIVHEELVTTLGGTTGKLAMNPKPPTVVMLAGLQGSGKTTAAAKLARLLLAQGRPLEKTFFRDLAHGNKRIDRPKTAIQTGNLRPLPYFNTVHDQSQRRVAAASR